MPELQVVELNDPKEFVEKIQTDQNDNIYVYIDDMFSPIGDIYKKAIEIYKQYRCSLIFTDIQTEYKGQILNQYFLDIDSPKQNKIIYSPLIARYVPIELEIYPELKYHSYSFLTQISKKVLPWHIPEIGFKAKIDGDNFKKLSEDSTWVLQQEMS